MNAAFPQPSRAGLCQWCPSPATKGGRCGQHQDAPDVAAEIARMRAASARVPKLRVFVDRAETEAENAEHRAWLAQPADPELTEQDMARERRERFWRSRSGADSYFKPIDPDVREDLR